MTKEKITILRDELLIRFEKFPSGLTYHELSDFVEWFNHSFCPKQNNKIYLYDCYLHYCNYIKLHYFTNKTLSRRNFYKMLQMALIEMELKQGFRTKKHNYEFKYYLRKRDSKSLLR